MQKLMKLKNKKGFTLIEMLIVILIIVILLAIAIPSVVAYREDAQRTADTGAAKLAYTALEAALTNEIVTTSDAWPWHRRDADGNGTVEEAYLREAFGPGSNSGSYPLGKASADFLKNQQFQGYIRYAYNIETNSINWVSYHEDIVTSPASTNQSADPSEVMVYDVVNDRTGYLDELMAAHSGVYTEAIHGH